MIDATVFELAEKPVRTTVYVLSEMFHPLSAMPCRYFRARCRSCRAESPRVLVTRRVEELAPEISAYDISDPTSGRRLVDVVCVNLKRVAEAWMATFRPSHHAESRSSGS